jgi:hypothetical protein
VYCDASSEAKSYGVDAAEPNFVKNTAQQKAQSMINENDQRYADVQAKS